MRIRQATRDDVPAIVALLADDFLGARREVLQQPLPETYFTAFAAIDADPNNELVVVEAAGEVIAVLQLTFISYLLNQGGMRALVEGVRVASKHRGQGIGEKLFAWAIERATRKGCCMLQLSTDKQRSDAKRFYERVGFVASHEGMKLSLAKSQPEHE